MALVVEIVLHDARVRLLATQTLLLRREIALMEEGVTIYATMVKHGRVSPLDFERLKADLMFRKMQLLQLAASSSAAESSLAGLLGRSGPEPAARTPAAPSSPLTPLGRLKATRLQLPPEQLLCRPDVLESEARLKAAGARVDVARATYLPRLSLQAGLSGVGGALALNILASLTQPLWDRGRIAGRVDLSEASRLEFEIDYRSRIASAFRESVEALNLLATADERARQAADRLDSIRRSVDLQRVRFGGGRISRVNLIQYERELLLAELDHFEVDFQRLSAEVGVVQAVGGVPASAGEAGGDCGRG